MRYLMTFSYDGTNYNGYQKQPNSPSIQEEIENNLSKINHNTQTSIHASGRTDAKVHALNQKAHFDLEDDIDPDKLKNSLNKMINNDIYIKQIVKISSDFHARFNVKEKTYIYKINLGEYDPINKNYIYQYNKQLDIDKMKEGLKQFIGEHDFTSFTSGDNIQASYIRTIYNAEINLNNNILTISFTGNGFLRYMVRNMVGILIKIGEHKYQPEDITTILNSKDRTQASITAEPNGLYLKDVKY